MQRNNNNCAQPLPSFTGEKKIVLDFHIPSTSAVPQAEEKADFEMEVKRCPGAYLSLVTHPSEDLYFVRCKRQWTSYWPVSPLPSHPALRGYRFRNMSFYTWQ